ncbi:High affinity cAMP-specific and IBMX-insensitive 3',5'-cyclic phosphodiesterase 8A [Kappamyces sp. JEL0680]|nr:High affinity cAMP-specific and IBMX-insensitive 3',5'-cyclic phosphodiesterase 8A [Kappamyces sp. JEL0680]
MSLSYSALVLDPVIEVIFPFGLVILAASFCSLRYHHIKTKESSIEKYELIKAITRKNKALRDELSTELSRSKQKVTTESSFISPIAKVIKMIRDLQVNCDDLDDESMSSLDYVIHLLLSNHLFKPELMNSNMESEVNQWLKQITESDENQYRSRTSETHSLEHKTLTERVDIGVTDKIKSFFPALSEWDFPLFEFAETTGQRPLFYMGMELFDYYKFEETLGISQQKMSRYLSRVEASYRKSNSYHNSIHATDVMHSTHFFYSVLNIRDMLLPEEMFAGLIAAAIHDVDHPGFNNGFMISSLSPLALRYNDVSVGRLGSRQVLENYHCAKGFEIMSEPGCEILDSLKPDQYKSIRSSIISMILATDMINHFEYITKFKNKINGDGRTRPVH